MQTYFTASWQERASSNRRCGSLVNRLGVLFAAALLMPVALVTVDAHADSIGVCPTEVWEEFYWANGLWFEKERMIEEVQSAINDDIRDQYRNRCIAVCATSRCFHYTYRHEHPDGTHSPTIGSAEDIERANPRINAPNGTLSVYAFEWVQYRCDCYHICPAGAGSRCAAAPRPDSAEPGAVSENPPAAAVRPW